MYTNIEQKRGNYLSIIDRLQSYGRFIGPEISLKIKKFIFFPISYSRYLLWRIKLFHTLKIKLFFGRKIVFNFSDDSEGNELCFLGILGCRDEMKLTKFFIKNLKESDVFYDIGANYGFYTYLALEFCKEVHSFEPLPDIFGDLSINLKNDSNVYLNNFALSDKEGIKDFYVVSTSSSFVEEALEFSNIPFKKKIKVQTYALDNYVSEHNKSTIIKMDIEGAESFVIDGGYDFFKNNNPVIAMEVWSKNSGGDISMRAVKKLRDLGYKSYFINDNGDLEIMDGDLVEKIANNTENFIFKKD